MLAMAGPTPANTKIRVAMNSHRYALREAMQKESSNVPKAIFTIFANHLKTKES
jgi:hypothetical protein